tara:strand:- start:1006 stop:1266 length:261 start_codon:yes stop_codon:yes gene_type:complete
MAIKTPKKITPQEIEQITTLQKNINELTNHFGQLHMSKVRLEEQENLLKDQLLMFGKEEAKLAKDFTDKYGKGSLDIETGEFTPTE